MQPSYHLRDTIGVAHFADCAIVLDIEADRYWQVPARLALAIARVAQPVAEPIAAQDLARLEALGLLVRGAPSAKPRLRASTVPVTVSALDTRSPDANAAAFVASVLWYAARGWVAVRTVRLARLLMAIERRRPTARSATVDLGVLARAFVRYRRLLPIEPVCLADSLGFLAMAARYGHYPNLVFGVTAHPFSAHCWVQAGETVLNDSIDHVTAFTPILAV